MATFSLKENFKLNVFPEGPGLLDWNVAPFSACASTVPTLQSLIASFFAEKNAVN